MKRSVRSSLRGPHYEVLTTSNWSVTPTGLTITDLEHESGITKVRASGGTVGQVYRLTNHVVTDGGDEGERSHVIRVAER